MIIFERIELFAKRVHGTYSSSLYLQHAANSNAKISINVDSGGVTNATIDEWNDLNRQIRAIFPHLPPITDPFGIRPFEAVAKINPHLIPAHVYMYGGSLILNSLVSHENPLAYKAMIEAATALARLGKKMRGNSGLSTIQTYIESIVSDFSNA